MGLAQFWKLLRRIDSLMVLEDKHEKAISSLRAEMEALKARVTRLEAREDLVISEARSAAGIAAGVAASGYMADVARRVGILEALAGQSSLPRLAPS